jgi:hypothetical protein
MSQENTRISKLEARVIALEEEKGNIQQQFNSFKDTHNYNVERYVRIHHLIYTLIDKLKKQKILDIEYSSPQELGS